MSKVNIRQIGDRVLILFNNQFALDLEWKAALELAGAIKRVALLAESHAKAEQIFEDQALLVSAGIPLGIVPPNILKGMPSIAPTSAVGTPRLKRG